MSTADWSVFQADNYDGAMVTTGRIKSGIPGNPKKSWMKRWLREGMRRTVRAVFIVHQNDVPHFLIFQQKVGTVLHPFLFGGKLQEGESERDGLTRILRTFIMKSKTTEECEWRVGELLSKFWRPEFDDRIYPYIPAHVTRPKEEVSIFQVVLPPKCVFALRDGMSISAMPIYDIVKNTPPMPPMIAALPSLVTRFTLYNYVPGMPGPRVVSHRSN